jgi:hypothetical protein
MAVKIDGSRPFSEVSVGGQAAVSDPARYAKWFQADAVGTGPLVTGQGRAGSTCRGGGWPDCSEADCRRAAPPIRPDLISGRDQGPTRSVGLVGYFQPFAIGKYLGFPFRARHCAGARCGAHPGRCRETYMLIGSAANLSRPDRGLELRNNRAFNQACGRFGAIADPRPNMNGQA